MSNIICAKVSADCLCNHPFMLPKSEPLMPGPFLPKANRNTPPKKFVIWIRRSWRQCTSSPKIPSQHSLQEFWHFNQGLWSYSTCLLNEGKVSALLSSKILNIKLSICMGSFCFLPWLNFHIRLHSSSWPWLHVPSYLRSSFFEFFERLTYVRG